VRRESGAKHRPLKRQARSHGAIPTRWRQQHDTLRKLEPSARVFRRANSHRRARNSEATAISSHSGRFGPRGPAGRRTRHSLDPHVRRGWRRRVLRGLLRPPPRRSIRAARWRHSCVVVPLAVLSLNAHSVAHGGHAGLPAAGAVDCDQTIEANAHQAIRTARLV
jgi:hypothetical protein